MLGGGGRGLCYPIMMALSIRSVPSADRATAMGVFQAVYALGMFAGPASTGFMGDAFGIASIFFVGGATCLIAMGIVAARVRD